MNNLTVAGQLAQMDHYLYVQDGGYREVEVGELTFMIGKDPSEVGRTTYEIHYSCTALSRMIGLPDFKRWKSIENFKKEANRALALWCRRNERLAVQYLSTTVRKGKT